MNAFISAEKITEINLKQRQLAEASMALKQHFCGIDDVIDKVIRSIEIWYAMPELLTRPLIVNLFGMTGVGKTDLVRRLVKLLNFGDRYCEIELTNDGCPAHPYADSVSGILSSSTLRPAAPGILLLDEIQRFRTIDQHDEEVRNYKFQDVWTLLGDGRLPYELDSEYLFQMIFATKTKKKKKKKQRRSVDVNDFLDDTENPSPSIPSDDDGEVPSFYTLKRFKEVLRLEEPLEKIATWTHEEKMKVVFQKMEDKSIYDHLDYTKLLIFVSGNIDEAYSFAKRAEEADVDADVFHQQSQQINILDIKGALKKRFRPEQIARFGNIHIIYPSLDRASYEQIIARRIEKIQSDVQVRWGVQMNVDNSMHRLIYNNGVFPVQGTRPVLSTISDAFENSLPSLLLQALIEKSDNLDIKVENGMIVGSVDGKTVANIPFVGALDRLREQGRHKVDQRIKTSVHEAGHGLVYGLLFKTAPIHISANAIASTHEGYVGCHLLSGSREMMHNDVVVCLAGATAEEIVFGQNWQTNGNESDLTHATQIATAIYRHYGMGEFPGRITSEMSDEAVGSLVNIQDTNSGIIVYLKKCQAEAKNLIVDNYPLFVALIDAAFAKESLTPPDVKGIFAKFDIEIDVREPRDVLIHNYLHRYQEFSKKVKSDKSAPPLDN